MPVVTPPPISAMPTPPSTSDPANFDARADAVLAAWANNVSQMNALGSNVFGNASDAATSASAAAASKTAAAASETASAANAVAAATHAGATAWVSGATYAIGDARYSLINLRVYRRITAGAGTTDPSLDLVNWAPAVPSITVRFITGTSVTAEAWDHIVLTNVAPSTVTLPATPASGDTVAVTPGNGLATNTIARNGQTIMGLTQDMTLDNAMISATLRFLNGTWRII